MGIYIHGSIAFGCFWGINNIPPMYRTLIEAALKSYSAEAQLLADTGLLKSFVKYMEGQIMGEEKMKLEEMADTELRGNLYIVQKGSVLLKQSNGYADLANQVPNTFDTRFGSASAGKVFVAVGILKLIESGKLHFDDTLGKILSIELHNIDPDVTVKQLLTHTSGVPDYFDEGTMDEYQELWKDYPNYKIRSNRDLLPLFIHKPMMYPKGERFQYNNSGYVLLALMIEEVTGMEFDLFLKKAIFDPCKMDSTGYYELDRLPKKCANHYIYCEKDKDYRTNIFCIDAKGTGAGGAFTSVEDIVKFWDGLIGCRMLSKKMTQEMLCVQNEEGCYGYGVWINKNSKGENNPYFEGCDPGVSFISEYDLRSDTASVLISNYGDNVWKEMTRIRNYMNEH